MVRYQIWGLSKRASCCNGKRNNFKHCYELNDSERVKGVIDVHLGKIGVFKLFQVKSAK